MAFEWETIETDVLVVGSGTAGMLSAVKAAEAGVLPLLVTKGPFPSGNTSIAQSGYGAAMGEWEPEDKPEIHLEDTLRAGMGLNERALVSVMTENVVYATREMLDWGLELIREEGKLHAKTRPDYTFPRLIHHHDTTGRALNKCLSARITALGIPVRRHVCLVDLIVESGRCLGAWGFEYRKGRERLLMFSARMVVFACGGGGLVFRDNDNPSVITGDGYAMAYRAGLSMVDMEMIDFQLAVCHPERLRNFPASSNALLVHGARFINGHGERFMWKYNGEGYERAPRAVINRAVALEIYEGRGTPNGGVYLDCSGKPAEIAQDLLPAVAAAFARGGVDLRCQPMELRPVAHTFLGGVKIDARGQTELEGLYAAGEVAGGLHGANRLGGNGLADSISFGYVTGLAAGEESRHLGQPKIDQSIYRDKERWLDELMGHKADVRCDDIRNRVEELMSGAVGLVREQSRLDAVVEEIAKIRADALPRLSLKTEMSKGAFSEIRSAVESINIVDAAEVIASAARFREESRGCHYRIDHPENDDGNWLVHTVVRRKEGRPLCRRLPVGYVEAVQV